MGKSLKKVVGILTFSTEKEKWFGYEATKIKNNVRVCCQILLEMYANTKVFNI